MKSYHLYFSFVLCLCISLCSEEPSSLSHSLLLAGNNNDHNDNYGYLVHFLCGHQCTAVSIGIMSPKNRRLDPNCLPHTIIAETKFLRL